MENASCHLCGAPALYEHEGYKNLKQVTSDCKPCAYRVRLCTCEVCSCTQARCDQIWQQSVQSIYHDYTLYYQGEGQEPKVFDSKVGHTLSRSEWLLECIGKQIKLSQSGRMLDFGYGNGYFLKAFRLNYPDWKLSGVEYDITNRARVKDLPGVELFCTSSFSSLSISFHFISLIHVLEHIKNPISFLKEIRSKLLPDGLLFIELPSYENNPFELLMVDHAAHFSLENIEWVLNQAGFSVLASSDQWVPKELSILAKVANEKLLPNPNVSIDRVNTAISWLQRVVMEAWVAKKNANIFGIFGTSIAGTWLATELGNAPDFFVDEDKSRAGHTHMGVPIYAPNDIPDKSIIFIAQPEFVSAQIASRLKNDRKDITYCYALD